MVTKNFQRIYKKQDKSTPGFGYWGDYGDIDIGLSSGFIPSLTHEYEEQPHAHTKGVTFFLILEGRGIIEVVGEDITVSKDDVVRIAPGELYRYKKILEAPFRWITMCTVKDLEEKVVVE